VSAPRLSSLTSTSMARHAGQDDCGTGRGRFPRRRAVRVGFPGQRTHSRGRLGLPAGVRTGSLDRLVRARGRHRCRPLLTARRNDHRLHRRQRRRPEVRSRCETALGNGVCAQLVDNARTHHGLDHASGPFSRAGQSFAQSVGLPLWPDS
jgi:hypothetical protein